MSAQTKLTEQPCREFFTSMVAPLVISILPKVKFGHARILQIPGEHRAIFCYGDVDIIVECDSYSEAKCKGWLQYVAKLVRKEI